MYHSTRHHHHRLYFTQIQKYNSYNPLSQSQKNSQKPPPPPPLAHKQFPCKCAVNALVSPEKNPSSPTPAICPICRKTKTDNQHPAFQKMAIDPLPVVYCRMMEQSPKKSNRKKSFPIFPSSPPLPANLVEPRPQPDGRARCLAHTTLPRYSNTK